MLRSYKITPEITYYVHHDHRNRTKGKSQWIISENEEVEVFRNSLNMKWLIGDVGWGLHYPKGKPQYLGLAQDHQRRVFIAKFVDRNYTNSWHGYPADHQKNIQDIPPERVMNIWLQESLLSPAKIRKILKGQPCSL